ncbi:hypothetical protein LTR94_004345 [Friedmanniomyces endolithicus]|nr:hypothetical protein LTR94_004345 [Friedmanniomyces endolithicus]
MSHKILVVEDDAATAAYIVKGMTEAGFTVDQADNGRDGLFLASDGSYGAIILDRMMPAMDGMAMLKALRAASIETPVIFLSALGTPEDRVEGLTSGSDDYLTKPFAFAELLARVQLLLRKAGGNAAVVTSLRYDDLDMDLLARRVKRAGKAIDLQPREFRLLEFFLRHPDQVVTRTMLLEGVWDYHFDPGTNVIDVHISRLRRKLDDVSDRPLLHTFLVTGGVLLFVQQASQRTVVAADRDAVHDLRDELLRVARERGAAGLRQDIERRLPTVRSERIVLLLTDAQGRIVAGNLGAWPTTIPDNTPWRTIELYRIGGEQPEPIGVSTSRLPDGGRLLAGIVTSHSLQLTRIYEEALTIAFLMSLLLTLIIAILLGRVLTRQISAIADTANAVAVGAFHRRVATDGSGDAFDRLGLSINAMLERIDALVSQLRMMTDGLAHDLKSPVTRLLSVVEQASTQTRDDQALDALEKVHREAQTLQGMLSTALLISRTEAGFGSDRMRDTAIAELLEDLAEVYGPLIEDSGFTLHVAAPAGLAFPLHRELVSQAIANLIENALKYAEGGDRIALEAAMDGDALTISVSDNGPGIPADQHEAAMKRFGRLDPSRTKPGSGLGLSLVEAVARLHHGALLLGDAAPGLRATLRLRRPA